MKNSSPSATKIPSLMATDYSVRSPHPKKISQSVIRHHFVARFLFFLNKIAFFLSNPYIKIIPCKKFTSSSHSINIQWLRIGLHSKRSQQFQATQRWNFTSNTTLPTKGFQFTNQKFQTNSLHITNYKFETKSVHITNPKSKETRS